VADFWDRILRVFLACSDWPVVWRLLRARRTAAEGMAYLVGDDSKAITVQTVHVNGGLVLP
jgi:hypothetical protein